MQRVESMSEGEVKLGPGTLYGALSKLEKQGLIKRKAKPAIIGESSIF